MQNLSKISYEVKFCHFLTGLFSWSGFVLGLFFWFIYLFILMEQATIKRKFLTLFFFFFWEIKYYKPLLKFKLTLICKCVVNVAADFILFTEEKIWNCFCYFKYYIDFQDLRLCSMVLIGNKYLTQGNSLSFCKANVSLDSKI